MNSVQKRRNFGMLPAKDESSNTSTISDESWTYKWRRRKRRPENVVHRTVRFQSLISLLGASCILVGFIYFREPSSSSMEPVSDAHHHVFEGDTSRRYLQLRQEYDLLLPYLNAKDLSRMRKVTKTLIRYTSQPIDQANFMYDIYNCPSVPSPDYPMSWNIMKVLKHWPPEEIQPPIIMSPSNQSATLIFQSLCIFDYQTQLDTATNYRSLEVPFVIRNDPSVLRTVERWNQPNYLSKLMGQTKYPIEYSSTNHFLYWDKKKAQIESNQEVTTNNNNTSVLRGDKWKQPTSEIYMTFDEWKSHTRKKNTHKNDHYYLRLIGCGMGLGRRCARPSAEFLFDELPFFKHTYSSQTTSFYLVQPKEQKGIHCRGAMQSTISESHFDDSRNFIALLAGGSRRYILSHPKECHNLYLYPKDHPSARQSSVNWSDPDFNIHPRFSHLLVNEVILNPGDVLYLPADWFHYIVSLDYNIQCNTRSGRTRHYEPWIRKCGF